MKYTNKQNLPQPIVDAIIQARSAYDRGDAHISATGLLRPPRIAVLEEAHADELEEDVADCAYSIHGQTFHKLMEEANTTGVTERRFFIKVEGWTVSGQADYFLRGLIADFKDVTAWKFKGVGVDPSYEAQLNIYAEIHRQNGHDVKRLELWAFLRDFSKLEARRDASYPQHQFLIRQVPLWTPARAQQFIRERVILHQQARVRLPECTPEERWAKPDTWAVMKRGGKRAVKLYTHRELAETHVAGEKSLFIVFRPGQSVRCSAYCAVSSFCSQYAKLTESEPAAAALATAEEV